MAEVQRDRPGLAEARGDQRLVAEGLGQQGRREPALVEEAAREGLGLGEEGVGPLERGGDDGLGDLQRGGAGARMRQREGAAGEDRVEEPVELVADRGERAPGGGVLRALAQPAQEVDEVDAQRLADVLQRRSTPAPGGPCAP
ncbi:MAG: hypothetical protein KIT58_24230 [Planctomycetota bacterium]|nr:hypothetical protein [Planctomycetota bacterium]